jgi:hypothetical protein
MEKRKFYKAFSGCPVHSENKGNFTIVSEAMV